MIRLKGGRVSGVLGVFGEIWAVLDGVWAIFVESLEAAKTSLSDGEDSG